MQKDKSGKATRATILVVGTIIALAMAYGSGLGQGNRAARKARDAQKAAEVRLSMISTETAGMSQRVQFLEARRHLHLALMALDERNFGTAQQHLDKAREMTLHAAGTGSDWVALAHQVSDVRLVAAEDLGQQRSRILDVARRFDQKLVPPQEPMRGTATPLSPLPDTP